QELVALIWKIGALAGGSHHATLAVDTDWDDDAAARRRAAADIWNDLSARKRRARRQVTFQPFGKLLPRIPTRDVDCARAAGVAQTHEPKVELQEPDQRVGEPRRDLTRVRPDPPARDRRQRDEISQ